VTSAGSVGRAVLAGTLLVAMLVLGANPAVAHPLDVYLQATYITVAPGHVDVELDLSPGVLVAAPVLAALDLDGDQQISDAEGGAYVQGVLQHVALRLDGKPQGLRVTQIDMPNYLTIQAGYGLIRVFTEAADPPRGVGDHDVDFRNDFTPTGSAYQVNAFVARQADATLDQQHRDDNQQALSVRYSLGASAAPDSDATRSPRVAATTKAGRLVAYLYRPGTSPAVLAVALVLAALLGALHALTPGHGKTLVAAYLVGNRAHVREAVTLGAVVTITHTASVIVIGLIALFASQFIVPDVLAPTLEVVSGLLVAAMGIRLLSRRWPKRRPDPVPVAATPDHGHRHDHDEDHHDHDNNHDHGGHDHDEHGHTHAPPDDLRLGSLVAMGVSGGLVPCPEALGVMVVAVGLKRILLGLGLIVAFSAGLAAVLIALGVMLVRSRSLMERFGKLGVGWQRALPLVSAVVVTVLGVVLTLRGLNAGWSLRG
jgi:nickel/cobalt exporter